MPLRTIGHPAMLNNGAVGPPESLSGFHLDSADRPCFHRFAKARSNHPYPLSGKPVSLR